MTPVPALLAEIEPLWFVEIPVCMFGGVIGVPIALLILLAIRKPIARRLQSATTAWAVGALVGAGLGALNFNLAFAIVLANSSRLDLSAAQIQEAILSPIVLFTVGGGFLGMWPGMLAVGTALHPERPAPSASQGRREPGA